MLDEIRNASKKSQNGDLVKLTVQFPESTNKILLGLCEEKELSRTQVIRTALHLYRVATDRGEITSEMMTFL